MATLAEMIGLMREHLGDDVPPAAIDGFERELRMRFGGSRVYVPEIGRKDPDRAERIRKLSRKLPVSVIAERENVSKQWVYRVVRSRR